MLAGNTNRGLSVLPALLALSIVLFVCMIGAYAFKPGDPGDADETLATPAPGLLDPDPYRPTIVALETILFRDSPGDFSTDEQVSGIAQRLALDVRGTGTDRRRHEAFGQLFDWAGRVSARAGSGYATSDLPRLRREWETVRNRVFAPADWFEVSGLWHTETQTRVYNVADPTAVRQLEVAADRLGTMIRRGRRRALSIPDASVDAGLNTRGAREATRRWNEFARRWSESVDDMGDDLPEHPGWDADSNLIMAHQELGQALNQLRSVTWSAASTTNIPFKYEREAHFDSAERRVGVAREYLAKLDGTH